LSSVIGGQFIEPCGFSDSLSLLFFSMCIMQCCFTVKNKLMMMMMMVVMVVRWRDALLDVPRFIHNSALLWDCHVDHLPWSSQHHQPRRTSLPTPTPGINGICDFVCLCLHVSPHFKTKTTRAINTKLGRTSACIDPEVKSSKVKIAGLWSVLPAWVCMSIWLI